MKLEELKRSGKEFLTCTDIAPVIGLKPDTIHWQAITDSSKLGFPVIVAKNRVVIPKAAFIRFVEGKMKTGPRSVKREPANEMNT